MKKNYWLYFFICIQIMIIGYFLQTILFPLQDTEMYTAAVWVALQKELAINYPLGKVMLWGGAIGAIVSLLLWVKEKIREFSKWVKERKGL